VLRSINTNKLVKKLKHAFVSAGKEVCINALILYYTFQDPRTPKWCQPVILGALAYFISLIDAVPDLTPLFGYSDDLTVLSAAVATIAFHIPEGARETASEKLDAFIGTTSLDTGANN